MMRGVKAASLALLASTSCAWAQGPSDAGSKAIIERARQKALDHAKTLPDFICTEVVNRFQDRLQRGAWVQTDKLTVRLSYYQGKEEHKLMLVNDLPTDMGYESVGGATGTGEFGSLQASLFDPATRAGFHWQAWRTVRDRRAARFSYVVSVERSTFAVGSGRIESPRKSLVGYHGVLDLDAETGEVLHLTYQADHIPRELRVTMASGSIDYDSADVGGRSYLLPERSQSEMWGLPVNVKNTMQFRDYRKFSADSSVTFGTAK